MNRNGKTVVIAIIVVGVGALVGWYVWGREASTAGSGQLDQFAQCLASKGVTMYGAEWCPHCQKEKKAFGSSFQYVPYVECPENPKACIEKGIEGYPTWILPASPAGGPDGRKLVGEQGLEKLSVETGCQLRER